MVAFLLVYSTEVEVIQNSKGIEIPQSIAQTAPKQSVVVMITRDDLFVQGEYIATVKEIQAVVFFKQKDPEYLAGSKLLAHLIMSTDFQTIFNQAKGSIPARMDVDLSKGFNPCQEKSQKDLEASIKAGTLVRSFAHNMTILQKYRGAAMEVITEFVNDPKISAADGAKRLGDAVEAQK